MVAAAGVAGQTDLAVLLCLLAGQIGEVASNRIVRLAGPADKVQRNGRELARSSGLEEEDMVVLRNVHQPAQLILCLLKDVHKHLGPVAHLHHGHAGISVVGKFRPGALQYGQREHGRTGGKIVNTGVTHGKSPFLDSKSFDHGNSV